MWPVFLKFSGGRGATAAGSVATAWLITPLLSWKVVACITPLVVGAIWRNLFSRHAPTRVAPLGLVLTFALLPVLTWLWGKPPEKDTIYLTFVAIFWLLAIRRLTADLRKELQEKPSTVSLKSILINRFLYDRSYR
jgi:glycerol-3-phosphate acyltransferase PlsY